jgi:short-subunit dehydrogenase
MMAVPFFAAFNVTRGLLPAMLERGRGTVVNLTSPAAFAPWPGSVAYSAARWAMRGFHEALRADLHGTGVQSMLVVPSTVESGYWAHNPGSRERTPKIGRLYRTLTPEDVAAAIERGVRHDRHEIFLPALLRATTVLQRMLPGVVRSAVIRTSPPAARRPE